MVKITYIQPDGREFAVEVKTGMSLMEAAVKNNVPGIEAQCGGACACATCHVYVEESWRRRPANLSRWSAVCSSSRPIPDPVRALLVRSL